MRFRPFQAEILPDACSSRFVRYVDLLDCLFLRCAIPNSPIELNLQPDRPKDVQRDSGETATFLGNFI
jgi:hypothetical protein